MSQDTADAMANKPKTRVMPREFRFIIRRYSTVPLRGRTPDDGDQSADLVRELGGVGFIEPKGSVKCKSLTT